MTSSDPYNNPVKACKLVIAPFTEEETATQRNKELAQSHSSQDDQTGTRTVFYLPVQRPSTHYIC